MKKLFCLLMGFVFAFSILCVGAFCDDSDTWTTFVNDSGAGTEIIDADDVNPLFLHMTGNWPPRNANGTRNTTEAYTLGSITYPWGGLTSTGLASFENVNITNMATIENGTFESIYVTGTATIEDHFVVGGTAVLSDFPTSVALISGGNSGYSASPSPCFVVESTEEEYSINFIAITKSSSMGAGATAISGYARSSGANDSSDGYGASFLASDVRAGKNYGISSWAQNGAEGNYSFYGTFGDIYNNGDATITGDVVASTLKAGGAEKLMFYTYTRTLAASDESANYAVLDITDVTLSKVRALVPTWNQGPNTLVWSTYQSADGLQYATTDGTKATIYFGNDILSGNVLNLMVVVAK